LTDENAEPAVKDAGLIVAAQKVEHYEIAAYGSVCVFAEMLGKSNIKKLLKQNLAQEEATDKSLSELAESLVNYEALSR
jgi:ferritin-like metal-binding protein YciE